MNTINEIFGNVQFPTGYWFNQDERGIVDGAFCFEFWTLVAIGKGGAILPTGAKGDLSYCPDSNCKLSDDEINTLDFDLIKFELWRRRPNLALAASSSWRCRFAVGSSGYAPGANFLAGFGCACSARPSADDPGWRTRGSASQVSSTG